MNLDLDRLEKLAREAMKGSIRWWGADTLQCGAPLGKRDAAYIAAASPGVVLGLLERVRTAEAKAADAWDEGVTACTRSHGHLRPMGTNPYRRQP